MVPTSPSVVCEIMEAIDTCDTSDRFLRCVDDIVEWMEGSPDKGGVSIEFKVTNLCDNFKKLSPVGGG